MTLPAESFGDPASLAAPLRELVHSLDASQPTMRALRYEEVKQRSTLEAVKKRRGTAPSRSRLGNVL
jgi:hypothetical protein